MLRDLLVIGFTDVHIHRCLMAEKKLNFDKARKIALAIESADNNVHDIAACSNTTALTQLNMSRIYRRNSGRGKSKKNHVFNVTASPHQIIVTSGFNLQLLPEN